MPHGDAVVLTRPLKSFTVKSSSVASHVTAFLIHISPIKRGTKEATVNRCLIHDQGVFLHINNKVSGPDFKEERALEGA